MQILGLLSMHFNAVVVKVKTFLLLFRLSLAILCFSTLVESLVQMTCIDFTNFLKLAEFTI